MPGQRDSFSLSFFKFWSGTDLTWQHIQETPSPGINRSNQLPVGWRLCQTTEGSKNNYSHQSVFDIKHLWHPEDQIVYVNLVQCGWTRISDSQRLRWLSGTRVSAGILNLATFIVNSDKRQIVSCVYVWKNASLLCSSLTALICAPQTARVSNTIGVFLSQIASDSGVYVHSSSPIVPNNRR